MVIKLNWNQELDFKEKKRMEMNKLKEIMNYKILEMKVLKSIRQNKV